MQKLSVVIFQTLSLSGYKFIITHFFPGNRNCVFRFTPELREGRRGTQNQTYSWKVLDDSWRLNNDL